MNESMTSNGTGAGRGVLVAAMVGMAVGAGVALLFAPCSGKEARGWLTRQATDLKRKTNNAIEQGKSALMYAKREIQSTADSIGSHDGPSARTMRS